MRWRALGPAESTSSSRSRCSAVSVEQRVQEGGEALARRRARAERRRAAQELAPAGRARPRRPAPGRARAVAEAVEDRALGDAGLARHVAHRHGLDAALGEQPPRRVEHAPAVAGRVGALRPGLGRRSAARPSPPTASTNLTVVKFAANLTAVNLMEARHGILAIPLLLLVGALLSLQAGANVQLATATRSPFGASALQLGLGAALLLALAARRSARSARSTCSTTSRPGTWSAGSAPRSTSRPASCSSRGSARSSTVGLFIAGQMLVSLLLDATGWLGVERGGARRRRRDRGALAVLAGVALIVRAQGGDVPRAGRGWIALALVAGAVLPVQGAINAQLRADLDAPIAAGAWSFVVAAAAMLVVLGASRAPPARGSPARAASRGGAGSAACAARPT